MKTTIENILEKNKDSDGFTTPLKGECKRYIVALTNNINPTLELLEKQIESFSQLDNINVGGWVNKQDNIKYIDISTSLNSEYEACVLGTLFNQKAIFDLQEMEEILI